MGLMPLAVLLPDLVVVLLVVVPAFIWTLGVVDDDVGRQQADVLIVRTRP